MGLYAPDDSGGLPRHPTGAHLRMPGECRHGAGDPRLIHRLANLSCGEAVSIHACGVPYDRFGAALNLVFAA